MRTVAVLDASVLHPAALRDLFLRLARSGLYQARWTREILDECFRSILRVRPDLDPARLRRTRELMEAALPDWEITGYEAHIDQLELPDLDDRHVLAAAIEARAQVIVTANLRDFPEHALEIHGIAALSPDDFVMGLIQADIDAVLDVIEAQAAALQRLPTTVDQLQGRLERSGLASSIARLRAAASGPEPAPRPPTRARCAECGEPVELHAASDPESWIHTADARDLGDHTAWVAQR